MPSTPHGCQSRDPGKLFLPVVQSLVYHYNQINVESQLAQSRSLLHWIRNVIHVRKAHPTFGLGSIRILKTNHESVLAFVREYAGTGTHLGDAPERILCVFSFAHNPVAATIDMSGFEGAPLWDLFGGADFPSVDENGHVTLTMATQSFYWLHVGDRDPHPHHGGGGFGVGAPA